MPDDIKVAAGIGDSTVAPPVATDDIGGRHFQRIKAGWGAEGVWNETTDTDGVRMPVGGGQIGALTETAPGTDTASSGLNGRLQRIAQRISTLITVAGQQATEATLDAILNALPTSLGQKTAANSLAVTLASDQSPLPITDPVNIAAGLLDGGSAAAGSNLQLHATATGLRLIGFSVRETTGTASALVMLRRGTSALAVPHVIVSLGPNESVREWYGPDGMASPEGIYLDRISGSTHLVAQYKVVS